MYAVGVTTEPKTTLTVFLGADLRSRLERAAREERRKPGELIRLVVSDWLDERDRTQ